MTDRARRQIAQARSYLASLEPGNTTSDLWRIIGGVEALLDLALAELQTNQGGGYGSVEGVNGYGKAIPSGLRADDIKENYDIMRKL